MPKELRQIVDDSIEKELNEYVIKVGANESSIMFLGELIDGLYKIGNFQAGEGFRPSLEILIPKLMCNLDSAENKVDEIPLSKACEFSNAYYALRDYIYMSFSNESSIEFTGDKNNIYVSIKDPTIFRQMVYEVQTFVLNSRSKDEDSLSINDVVPLLAGTQQWDFSNPKLVQALESIEREVDWKIKHFFSHISEDSEIEMGGYSYREFLAVYKELLYLSLYERYHSKANNLSCVITYQENELSDK